MLKNALLFRRIAGNWQHSRTVGRRFLSSSNGAGANVLQTLRDRGLVSQVSQPESVLENKLVSGEKVGLYCGADPTAKSLHLGNLLPLMVLLHFYIAGHDVYTLVGGATGQVGDPSGRKTERAGMADWQRLENVSKIQGQLRGFFESGLAYYKHKTASVEHQYGRATHTNNYDWWHDMRMLDFLALYGRHIRVQSMLNRDSVSSRLGSKEGIGFNEFTYQILQAFDYYHLNKTHGVTVQVGGNDQWGNITAGIDLINRVGCTAQNQPFGLTVPLLTTSSGEKFGKSAGNAVFIDPHLTKPYELYQYFIQVSDDDVEKLLKTFTLLPLEHIKETIDAHASMAHERGAQRLLAREVVDLIHGMGSSNDAEIVSEVLFGAHDLGSSATELIRLFQDANILYTCSRNLSLEQIITQVAKCSKSEARRKLKQGSIYVGPRRTKVAENKDDVAQYLIDGQVLILRVGKQKCYVIEVK
ncbi:LADA_0D03818g1_1 [Lachancea dasiensis]|uniref:Tyrosine--tRNA ligase n=1 Tax=Lachancea dasiensis TaxID=1072105 RepID=A0A1G4J4Q9_9SACH|nr:LADA_0D03818g1_1 [Lachancea dasiensis]